MSLETIAMLALCAGGLTLVTTAAWKRRFNQARLGIVLTLAIVPIWALCSSGTIPLPRSMIVVAPIGSEPTLRRFLSRLDEDRIVAVVRLAPVPAKSQSVAASGDKVEIRWRACKEYSSSELAEAPTTLATSRWLSRIAESAARTPRGFFSMWLARPTVVVLHNDLWSFVNDSSVLYRDELQTLGRVETDLAFVDCTDTAVGSGRLDVALASPYLFASAGGSAGVINLRHNDAELAIELANCSHEPRDGKYVLTVNVNPSAKDPRDSSPPQPFATLEVLDFAFARPSGPRMPLVGKVNLADLKDPAGGEVRLLAGMHLVRVEVSFEADVGAVVVPLKFERSIYVEVITPQVVVVDDSARLSAPPIDADDELALPTWIHRRWPGPRVQPPLGGELLQDVAGPNRISSGNARMPFVDVASIEVRRGWQASVRDALPGASELILIEPRFETLVELGALGSPDVGAWIERGGSLVIVGPPAIPPGGKPPQWMIAARTTREPSRASFERRVYFLADASRPGSVLHAYNGATTGADCQADVINAVYGHFRAAPRDAAPRTVPTGPVQAVIAISGKLLVQAKWNAACTGESGGEDVFVIPPLFGRPAIGYTRVRDDYYDERGDAKDVEPSWIANRVWSLDREVRSTFTRTDHALESLVTVPSEFLAPPSASIGRGRSVQPLDMDLALDTKRSTYSGAVVIAFALDVGQPPAAMKVPPALPYDVWSDTPPPPTPPTPPAPTRQLPAVPTSPSLASLRAAGVKIVAVPIKLHQDHMARYEAVSVGGGLDTVATKVTRPIDLSNSDVEARASVNEVIADLKNLLDAELAIDARTRIVDHARAVDLRVAAGPIPRRVHAMDAVPVEPPARPLHDAKCVEIERPGTTALPLIYSRPIGLGSVTALAYSPLAFDRWSSDRALHRWPDSAGPAGSAMDGWGLQRFIDPISLRSGGIVNGLRVESIAISPDGSLLTIEYVARSGNRATELPKMLRVGTGDEIPIHVASIDPLTGRARLAITGGESGIEGNFSLEAGAEKRSIYVALKPRESDGDSLRSKLEAMAGLSGGAAIPESGIDSILSIRVPIAFFGGVAACAFAGLALSPWLRHWAPLRRAGFRRRVDFETIGIDDDAAHVLAAFNQSGMNPGQATAQRPAGRIMMLRPMRPGDSPLAARRSDWGFFAPDVAATIGSPPLPKVRETPLNEAASYLTIVDLHPGAFVNDDGSYGDRRRAMLRITGVVQEMAKRRSSVHRLASLQARSSEDDSACPDLEDAARTIDSVSAAAVLAREVPEILTNEIVMLIVDGGFDVETTLPKICDRCAEASARLYVVILHDLRQTLELGTAAPAGYRGALDRSAMERADVRAFQMMRAEKIAARASVVDGGCVAIHADRPMSQVVVVLEDLLCST